MSEEPRSSGPSLELDWEEGLFKIGLRLWRWLRPPPPPAHRPESATWSSQERHLQVLASLLAGRALRVLPASGEGGLRGDDLLLPPALDMGGSAEQNQQALLLRLAVGAALARSGDGPADPLAAARRAAQRLAEELPGFRELHQQLAPLLPDPPGPPGWAGRCRRALDLDGDGSDEPSAEPGQLPAIWTRRLAGASSPGAGSAQESAGPPSGTERQAPPRDEVERVTIEEERAREKVVQHSFEKVETLDEHRGQQQRMDGADELDAHLEALDELDLRQVIRGGDRAQSLYRAEIGLGGDIPDVADELPGEEGIPYDEWDQGAGRYRPGWCTVYPTQMGLGDPRWAAAELPRQRARIEELTQRLRRFRDQRRSALRQRDGDVLDMDAVVDSQAERLGGRSPDERVWERRRREGRSTATTVLLDLSLSTEAWVDNRRVLDVTREAALVLGEVAQGLGDPLQMLAFASQTRLRCRVWTLRDWGEPWALGRARLGLLRPQGYTRMGPALRHAARQLARSGADRRLLLLISDGKPTDLDRYEGGHGLADIRQALREAQAQGVRTHALAIDPSARDHLPAMLGPGAWHILPRAEALPDAMTTIYGQLIGR